MGLIVKYSPSFKTVRVAKKISRIINSIVSIWRQNMLGYLTADVIGSSKFTVFLKLCSRKTVRFSEQITSAKKYPSELRGRTEKVWDDLGGESRRRES